MSAPAPAVCRSTVGGFATFGRGRRNRAAADLHPVVVEELGDDEERARRGDHQADRPPRRQHRRPPRSPPAPRRGRPPAAPPRPSASARKNQRKQRPQPAPEQRRRREQRRQDRPPGPPQRRVGPLQTAIGRPSIRRLKAMTRAPRRCYHRASLRLFCRSSLRRAPWGLFFAPIPSSAGSSPFHPERPRRTRTTKTSRRPTRDFNPTERNHGTQLSTREDPEHRDHGAHRRR